MTLPIPPENFVNFLLEARRQVYAPDYTAIKPLLRGAHQLEFRQGALFYRNIYFGEQFFVGQETVYFKSAPIWGMGYAGGVLPEISPDEIAAVFTLLKDALQRGSAEYPFRGPASRHSGDLTYVNRSLGNIERFSGAESISRAERAIYHLNYSGGMLR